MGTLIKLALISSRLIANLAKVRCDVLYIGLFQIQQFWNFTFLKVYLRFCFLWNLVLSSTEIPKLERAQSPDISRLFSAFQCFEVVKLGIKIPQPNCNLEGICKFDVFGQIHYRFRSFLEGKCRERALRENDLSCTIAVRSPLKISGGLMANRSSFFARPPHRQSSLMLSAIIAGSANECSLNYKFNLWRHNPQNILCIFYSATGRAVHWTIQLIRKDAGYF